MGEVAAFAMATPAMIVGQPLDAAPPALGLGEPFALLGGDQLGPGGLPFRLLHEHQPAFLRWVRESCDDCLAAERPWFRGRPALLTGVTGAGRCHAARWLARVLDVPFAVMNLTDPVIAASIAASRQVSEALWALPVTVAMAAARCANPVVLVVGLEQASDDTVAGFLSMVDPAADCCWREDRLRTLVDLGEVTWLIQCDQAIRTPAALRRLATVVSFQQPPGGIDTVFALSVLLEAMGDFGIAPANPAFGWERIRPLLPHYRSPTGKGMYATMAQALTTLERGATPDDGTPPPF